MTMSEGAKWKRAERRADRHRRPFRMDDIRIGALQAKALAQGGSRKGRHGVEWNVAGKGKWTCIQPREVMLLVHEGQNTPVGPSATLRVRCRNCEPCLKAWSSYWKICAMKEIESAHRTWFITLTVRPEERLRVEYAASQSLDRNGCTDRCPKVVFRERLKALSPHVTRYLKRLRKAANARFRYLLVWEDHKCPCDLCEPEEKSLPGHYGFPHAHILLHEIQGAVSSRCIEAQWPLGFSKPKLIDEAVGGEAHKYAAYVCKYISKSMLCRVRASLGYGS